jgi:hypothetical protein
MRDLHMDDSVTISGRTYYVRGFSPMGVSRCVMYLEDAETGDQIAVPADEIARIATRPSLGRIAQRVKRCVPTQRKSPIASTQPAA